MTVQSTNLIELINLFDKPARIPALRAVVHTSLSRTIGALRQHIRAEERKQRDEAQEEAGKQQGLDQRNAIDEALRSVAELQDSAGFAVDVEPMKLAASWHQVWVEANSHLHTVITNKFDEPLTPDGMLSFMTERSQPLDEALIKALCDIVKCKPEDLRKMHELQDRQDRERMKAIAPQIKAMFDGLTVSPVAAEFSNGYDDAFHGWDALPVIAKHQMGVKIAESLLKAKNQVLVRVMRNKKLTDLGDIPMIDANIGDIKDWVTKFEDAHTAEIAEALDGGANIRTLEDVLS